MTSDIDEEFLLPPSEEEKPLMSKTTRMVVFTIAMFGISSQYLYYLMPAPFLANEVTDQRGGSKVAAGVVYSSMCFSLFCTMILAPKTSAWLSIRVSLVVGSVLAVLSTVFYLINMPDRTWIVYSVFSRILQGVYIGLTEIRYMDIMTQCFPNRLSLVASAFELAYSACQVAGSALGGVLYQNFGFWFPLNLATVIVLIAHAMAFLSTYRLPETERTASAEEEEEKEETGSMKHMTYWPILVLVLMVMSSVAISDSIAVSFFGHFMSDEYEVRESGSGVMLTIAAIFYTAATFAAGIIGTKQSNLKFLILGGLVCMGVSCCILGTKVHMITGKNLDKGVYFQAAIITCVHIGSGFAQVASLPLLIGHYQAYTSLPENLASCHMGGLYSAAFFFGSFVGPTIGGFIISLYSYGISCTVAGLGNLLAAIVLLTIHHKTKSINFLNPWTRMLD